LPHPRTVAVFVNELHARCLQATADRQIVCHRHGRFVLGSFGAPVRIVDMSGSNAWAEFTGIFARTRAAYLEHEQAKTDGAVSFPAALDPCSHAAVE
jgi:hypothetical protein